MKLLYKTILTIGVAVILIISCKTSSVVSEKNGAQLWSESCVRCHYAPSPTDYSDQQWELIGTHMQVRALITQSEKDKIVEFLKSAN